MSRIHLSTNHIQTGLVERPLTIQEMKRQELLFPVRKADTDKITRGYRTVRGLQKCIVGKINGEHWLLNNCSDGYNLVPNEAIFPVIEQMLDNAGIKYQATYRHIDYSKFYVEYVLTQESKSVLLKDDVIFPKIQIHHSYNGQVKCSLMFGLYRLVCANGLTVGVQDASNFSVTVKHMDRMDKELENFFNYIMAWIDQFRAGETHKEFITLAEREIPKELLEQRVEEVIANVGDFPKAPVKAGKKKEGEPMDSQTKDLALSIIQRESDQLGYKRGNDWLVYNGLNEALYSDLSDKHPEFKRRIDSDLFEYILNNPLEV